MRFELGDVIRHLGDDNEHFAVAPEARQLEIGFQLIRRACNLSRKLSDGTEDDVVGGNEALAPGSTFLSLETGWNLFHGKQWVC